MAGIGGADQRFQAGAARHQIRGLRRDRNAARAHSFQELLLRRGRARAQVLLRQPGAIERKTHVGVAPHLFQQAIEVAVLQFLDLRLVVREADIEVGVRHHVDRELAFGREPLGMLMGLAVEHQGDARFGAGGNSGTLNSNRCWPKRRGSQFGAILRARHRQGERPARDGRRRRHRHCNQLAHSAVLFEKK